MAEPKDSAERGKDAAPESKNELPQVESPSIAPGADAQTVESIAPLPAAENKPAAMPADRPRMVITRRSRRTAALAATVALAAGFGAAIGALASSAFTAPAVKSENAGLVERQAMQQSIAQLANDISTLKTSIEIATKTTTTQIGKVAARIEPVPETTASITKPGAAEAKETPLPSPRPPIVPGWSVRQARDGYVLVEGRGELFRVSQGMPLPGLGPVEAIRREGGRWIVVTPKGIITSSTASAAIRPRPYYPPYFRPY
jgi:hypothetical protein